MIDSRKLSKILFHVITVGIFFILFAPLVIHNQFFFPFIGPRNVFFRVFVEIIFVAWLILLSIDSTFRPNFKKFSKLTWLIIAFFGINLISAIFGIGLYRSFWSNYERMGGVFHFAHLLAFLLVLISVFRSKKDWHVFLTFSIFASTLMALLAFAQWLEVPFLLSSSGGKRLTGTAGNATFLAAYLIFNFFFILYFWAKETRFSLKTFVISFLTFDIYLVASSLLFKMSPAADWGFFSFLKLPLLGETIKRAFGSKEIYTNQDISTAGILLGFFIILQVIIFTVWFMRARQHAVRLLLSILFILVTFIIYNTQTRGAILGIVAGLIFLAGTSLFLRVDKKIKRASAAFLLLMILTPFVLFAAKDTKLISSSGTLSRLATISLTDITTETRLLTWKASWQGMIASPKTFLIGYGPENYYYVFNKNFPVEIYKDAGSRVWFDRAHNIIFDVGVTTGIIGLALYLSILVFAGLGLYKKYKESNSLSSSFILMALIIAYFIQNLFVFDTLNTDILFYFFLAFVIFLSFSKTNEGDLSSEALAQEEDSEIIYKKINYIYVSGLIVVLLVVMFTINARTLKANNYIYKGLVAVNSSTDYEVAFEFLKSAIDEALPGRFEARQQLANFVNGLSNDQNIPSEKFIPLFKIAMEELEKSVDEEPSNVRHYIFLSTYYNAMTRFDRSNSLKIINLLEPDGIALSPTRPQLYYEIGQAYAFLANFEKSFEYFQKGVNLAPGVLDDRWNLLTISIVFEKFELAEEIYQGMVTEFDWTPNLKDYKKLVSLYSRVNNALKMLEFQNLVIDLEESASNYAQLAAIHAQLGNNSKARQATQRAVDIDLDFAPDSKNFLQLLDSGQLLKK